MAYTPTRLDFFAAAALTGLLANGHQYGTAAIAAANLAAETVRELDSTGAALAAAALPGPAAFKKWAALLTAAVGSEERAEVVREAHGVRLDFDGRELLNVAKAFVWLQLPETPSTRAANLADEVLRVLGLAERVEHNSGKWYVVEKDGTRTYLTADPHKITR